MINFNLDLEKLNQTLRKLVRLEKAFSDKSFTNLVQLISQLDPNKKGYLTPVELTSHADPELRSFFSQIHGDRISYSALATYIQAKENTSSFFCIDDEEQVNSESLKQLLLQEFNFEKGKKYILCQLHKYMLQDEDGIGYSTFKEYCQNQKLLLDPKLLFGRVAGNQQRIEMFIGNRPPPNSITEVCSSESKYRITQLQRSLTRLNERVQKFGMQWL